MAKITRALEKGVKIINSALRYVCVSLLFIMMLLGTGDVAGRYLFNKPIIGTLEIFEMLLPAIFLLGLASAQEARAHIRIEFLLSHLPSRTQTILNFIANGFALAISILIVWQGWELAISFWHTGRMIGTIWVPLFLPHLLVPLGALMLSLVLIIQMLQYLAQLGKGV